MRPTYRWGSVLWMLLWVGVPLFTFPVLADSLWQEGNNLSYATYKPRAIGDIITILIEEESLAEHSADTDTSTRSQADTNFNSTWGDLNQLLGGSGANSTENVGFGGTLTYRGKGKTQRESEVKSKITVTVIEVKENGNLAVVGKKVVKVNDETEEITVKGVVRSQDITPENTILSNQVADAEISIKGAGAVADKQSPGLFIRFFDWLF